MKPGARRLERIDRLLWWHGPAEKVETPPAAKPKRKLAKRYAWKHAIEHLRSAWTLLKETR